MPREEGTHQVVTAALTECGSPVYLQAAGRTWTRALDQASPIADPSLTKALFQWASCQEQQVCDAYVIGVRLDERSRPVPLTQRERIRASGPTVPASRRHVA